MSIPMDAICLQCVLRRNIETAEKLGDPEKVTEFARRLIRLMADAPDWACSCYLGPQVEELLRELFHVERDRYLLEKERSNRFILERMDQVRATAESAKDTVLAALKLSILGNYLDFSALGDKVDFRELDKMLESALEMELPEDVYSRFCHDLEGAGKLLYVTDNAGEIGFDRILAEELHRKYPNLEITFCVRGFPAVNDATREDAAAVGIPFPVMDSGSPIAGTHLEVLPADRLEAFREADVILAKGMGNIESMHGCGLNVYYAFLIKCQRFVTLFGKPMMTPMFIGER